MNVNEMCLGTRRYMALLTGMRESSSSLFNIRKNVFFGTLTGEWRGGLFCWHSPSACLSIILPRLTAVQKWRGKGETEGEEEDELWPFFFSKLELSRSLILPVSLSLSQEKWRWMVPEDCE